VASGFWAFALQFFLVSNGCVPAGARAQVLQGDSLETERGADASTRGDYLCLEPTTQAPLARHTSSLDQALIVLRRPNKTK
jgi:hypothetical protein